MNIRAFIACVVCKAAHAVLRLFGRGATSFPGRAALKICPDVLAECSRGVIAYVITGTNGKTTSARMTETALINAGYSVFSNRSGANLHDGITCEYIMNTDFLMRPKKKIAVIECDEAACRVVLPKIHPSVLLVTNLFRDQLDRYGSVSKPRDCIAEGLKGTPDTVLCVNADCPMAASIAEYVKNRVQYFGFSGGDKRRIESGEDETCPVCGAKLRYSYLTYANLGGYSCPHCGFARHSTSVSVESVLSDGSFVLSAFGERRILKAALPGAYNIYNAAGVISLVTAAGIEQTPAIDAVSDFECGFGRAESFPLGKSGAKMILIKNAAAADQTLELIRTDKRPKCIAFIINDRPADGMDISWLNDADFVKLRRMHGPVNVYAAGDRAETLSEILKKQGIACQTVSSCDKLLKILSDADEYIYLLPTYTAMLELRQKLVRRLGGKNFWE